jgi:outer membrane immunogenic protein
MKRFLLATIALAALAAVPAGAADLSRPIYKAPPPPPPVPVFTWTGCYIGGNVGGLWVNKDVSGPFGGTVSADGSSWAAGLQAGCDYQFAGGFVVGIQADHDWTNADFNRDTTGFFFNHPSNIDFRVKSVTSLTGRLGYGWDRFLGYVKGGVAWERDELSVDFFNTGVLLSRTDTRSGWTIGIGGEYAFTNWITAFAEWDYYNFGGRSNDFVCGPRACFGTTFDLPIDVKETKSVFKVGLNFRFGAVGKGPVAARY